MAKRRLSRQQVRRIRQQREASALRSAGAPDQHAESADSAALGPEQQGLVTARFSTQVNVEPLDAAGPPQRCHLRANLEGLVTGDRVVFRSGSPTGVVVAQLPRKSLLQRPDAAGTLRPVAANIEQLAVVIAPLPAPHSNLLDRYLVAAEAMGATPLIVVNKSDLLADPAMGSQMAEFLEIYPGLGYRIIYCSALGDLEPLRAALRDRVSVLVGQSGVGKTSLVNTLLPNAKRRTGALSEGADKGRHTTTTAELHHLPGGGSLIDSPGIREFGLSHLSRDQIEAGFPEFRQLLGKCKFRDCAHDREPGCALLLARDAGTVSERRLASYRYIVGSLGT